MRLDYRPAILLACAMALALAPAEPVGAADRSHRIVFKKTTPNDDIWPAILAAFFGDDGVRVIAKVDETTVSQAERKIREKSTWIAWFDLDEDGKDELFVIISQSYTCGSMGCDGTVLEHDANGWRRLSSLGPVPMNSERPLIVELRDSERADFYRKSDRRRAKLIEKYGRYKQSPN